VQRNPLVVPRGSREIRANSLIFTVKPHQRKCFVSASHLDTLPVFSDRLASSPSGFRHAGRRMKYDEKAIDLRMRFDFPGSHYFPAGRNWQMENDFRYADLSVPILSGDHLGCLRIAD
jgi:hypothetical protein